MSKRFPLFQIYGLAFLSLLFYLVVLSDSGIWEREKWVALEREETEALERLSRENLALEEKERLLQNDTYALEKEAKKYYFLSGNAQVLKFQEPKTETPKGLALPEGPKQDFFSLTEARQWFFGVQVFLWVALLWKWKGLPILSN